jgi:hypothetical protein
MQFNASAVVAGAIAVRELWIANGGLGPFAQSAGTFAGRRLFGEG